MKSIVARRISGTFIATLLLYGTAALTGPLAARLLHPEGRGVLAAIQLWPGALAIVAMLGLTDAIIYFGAREPQRAGEWLFTAQAIAFGSGCLAAAVGYPVVSVALRAYDPAVVRAAHIYLLLIPLGAMVNLPFELTRALGRFAVWNILRILPGVAWLAILLVSFRIPTVTPASLAFAYLAFLGVEGIVLTAVYLRAFRSERWFVPATARTLIGYGIPAGLGAVPQFLNLRLDQMLIAAFLPAGQLGLYVVAVAWAGLSGVALTAIGPVLFQRIAAEGERAHARVILGRATRTAIVVGSVTAAAFAALTPVLMTLVYGQGFRGCIPAAMVLVGANAIATTNGILEDGLRGLGDPRAILVAELAGLGATFLSLLLFLGPLGILGAAIASVIGYATVTAGLMLRLRRHDVTLRDTLQPRVSDLIGVFRMATALRRT